MPTYEIEEKMSAEGYNAVCGIDEAGRGPLSGPVCAAAVILPRGLIIEGLNDSKKLTAKKREKLFDIIIQSAIAYGIGLASPEEIDAINILNADMLAMKRAIEALQTPADFALVDGNIARDLPIPAMPVIKGDALSYSIAAASVLAKVTRDRLCLEDDKNYPEYGFAKHKGYGTKDHMDALRRLGPSPIHRKSFLKFLDENEKP